PPAVTLSRGDAYQTMVVVATRQDGVTLDVTDQVEWQLEPAGGDTLAVRQEGNVVHPAANGRATLKVRLGDLATQSEIEVTNYEKLPPVSYIHDVIPVLTRTGCNAGACHGLARGKDGFRMSLFGFDPAGDYTRMTRELATRRINLAL